MWNRLAIPQDCQSIFDWRNDFEARKNFVDDRKLSQAEHDEWFASKLFSDDCILVIFGDKNVKIGVVRLDYQECYYSVSINLNPGERGKGYGSKMLITAEKYVEDKKEIILNALIKKDNVASQKIFAQAGYQFEKTQNELFLYVKTL